MKKLKKNKGILFWITGLSGSGKTAIAEKVKSNVSKKYGPTITLSGDDLRKIFNYNKFSRKNRLTYALSYSKICKYITDKKINVILSTVSLFHKVSFVNFFCKPCINIIWTQAYCYSWFKMAIIKYWHLFFWAKNIN